MVKKLLKIYSIIRVSLRSEPPTNELQYSSDYHLILSSIAIDGVKDHKNSGTVRACSRYCTYEHIRVLVQVPFIFSMSSLPNLVVLYSF